MRSLCVIVYHTLHMKWRKLTPQLALYTVYMSYVVVFHLSSMNLWSKLQTFDFSDSIFRFYLEVQIINSIEFPLFDHSKGWKKKNWYNDEMSIFSCNSWILFRSLAVTDKHSALWCFCWLNLSVHCVLL